ncbi:MAG: ATP-binding cassette domain-containing protein [Nocardioides sp.]|uniref:ATP-binding cassette domain-containing protein n=1 Tax=Nocardioides sp. TaxID=35761 RepID=UPI0039E49605
MEPSHPARPELAHPSHHPTYDPADSVVRVRDLHRSFTPTGGVLAGLDLDLRAGEVVCLTGRRGSGKSTLLRALARLDRDVVGSGTLRLPEVITVLDADPALLGWRRVLDNITTGLGTFDALRRGRRALAEVGLAARELAWPDDLDDADRHRVALARTTASGTELLLADEPYRGLDAFGQGELHRLLRRAAVTHQMAVLLVTGDVHEAITLADRIITLRDGRIHHDLRVRGREDRAPVGEAYAGIRTLLEAELGLRAGPVGVPTTAEPVARRETA